VSRSDPCRTPSRAVVLGAAFPRDDVAITVAVEIARFGAERRARDGSGDEAKGRPEEELHARIARHDQIVRSVEVDVGDPDFREEGARIGQRRR